MPTPWSIQRIFGYVTNVFTYPSYRNQGIGTRLIKHLKERARHQNLEMLVLWPSQRAVPFFQRGGFYRSTEAMEYPLNGD